MKDDSERVARRKAREVAESEWRQRVRQASQQVDPDPNRPDFAILLATMNRDVAAFRDMTEIDGCRLPAADEMVSKCRDIIEWLNETLWRSIRSDGWADDGGEEARWRRVHEVWSAVHAASGLNVRLVRAVKCVKTWGANYNGRARYPRAGESEQDRKARSVGMLRANLERIDPSYAKLTNGFVARVLRGLAADAKGGGERTQVAGATAKLAVKAGLYTSEANAKKAIQRARKAEAEALGKT